MHASLSKAHKFPFKHSIHKMSKTLELIHFNVWGLAPISSHFGFLCYVIFMDEFIKYIWLFSLKRKSDILHTFTKFQIKVEI